MKGTRHNGRSGKNGVYNPLHNDRRFNPEHSEHIDNERVRQNIYWDCYQGYTTMEDKGKENNFSFEQIELAFYEEHYGNYVMKQNERHVKARHPDRCKEVEDVWKNKKTCPEESIYQLGTIDEHASVETLILVFDEFKKEFDERFGSNVHIIDWSLHMDEATPHIHERHVFDATNRYGEIEPKQETALEELGFELPDPEKKRSKTNNRKVAFDSACRSMFLDICKRHGLELDEEPSYGGRKYLEKQDYIRMKQKEEIADQQETILMQIDKVNENRLELAKQSRYVRANEEIIQSQEEKIKQQDTEFANNSDRIFKQGDLIEEQKNQLEKLTLEIDDIESLLQDVSDVAYEKAVEEVTNEVMIKTRQDDIQLIEGTKNWIDQPQRKASEKEKDNYARQGIWKEAEFHIEYSEAAIELNENGMSGMQAQTPITEQMVEDISAIDGVEKVEELKSFGVSFDFPQQDEYDNDDYIYPMNKEETTEIEKYIEEGTADYDKLMSGDYVLVADNTNVQEIYGWQFCVGDTLTLHYYDGNKMAEKEVTVLGLLNEQYTLDNSSLDGWFVMPEEAVKKFVPYESLNAHLLISVDTEKESTVGAALNEMISQRAELSLEAYADRKVAYAQTANTIFGTISGLAIFIMMFSILSMMNTLITNIVTRKQELAMLESIGMSKGQIRKMLLGESLLLVFVAVAVTMTIGTLLGYVLTHLLYNGGAFYISFKFPTVFVLAYTVVLIAVPLLITIVSMHSFSKEALVERLRGMEN